MLCVRRNAQHLVELKRLESTQFVLNTVVVILSVSTRRSTGCPASPPPLPSQNMQSHEKSHTNRRVRGGTPTVSLALGTNREGRERVKVKASRIQSSRIGSALLVCVRRNVQHRELKLPEFFHVSYAGFCCHGCCVCVGVRCHPIYPGRLACGRTSRGHIGGRSHRISPPPFCGACLNFSREKDSAVPFPRRPRSRILCSKVLISPNRSPLVEFCFVLFFEICTHVPTSEGFEVTN